MPPRIPFRDWYECCKPYKVFFCSVIFISEPWSVHFTLNHYTLVPGPQTSE